MKIELTTQKLNTSPNFQSAYMVRGVNLSGKYYGRKKSDTVYQVTKVLYENMMHETLSKEMKQKIYNIFPDFRNYPFVMIGRMFIGSIHNRWIDILTGYDAQEYKNTLSAEESPEVRNWTLNRIVKKSGNKEIIISAEENNGKITITDIEQVKK